MATYTDPTTIIPTGGPKKIDTGALLGLIAGVIAVLVAAFFYYSIYSTKKDITSTQNDISSEQSQVAALSGTAQQIQQVTTEATNLHSIFDNQVPWNTVINNVQAHLYRNMAITSFQLTDASILTFKGYTPTYLDYAKLYRSLTDSEGQKYFSNVHPSSVATTKAADGSQVVSFVFSATLTPEIMSVVPKVPASTAVAQ